jgi:hypothetical protein
MQKFLDKLFKLAPIEKRHMIGEALRTKFFSEPYILPTPLSFSIRLIYTAVPIIMKYQKKRTKSGNAYYF